MVTKYQLKKPVFFTKNDFYAIFSTMVQFVVRIFQFWSLPVKRFLNDMLLIVFVYFVRGKPISVRKLSTIGIDKVISALSFVNFDMVLVFHFLHSIAGFSNITSFHYFAFVVHWRVQRVWQGAISSDYQRCWELHLIVCFWGSSTNVFRVCPVLLISEI